MDDALKRIVAYLVSLVYRALDKTGRVTLLNGQGNIMVAKKNLILGTITRYKFHVIEPFFTSLKLTGYAGDVVIFYSGVNQRTLARMKDMGIILIPFAENFPYLDANLAKHIHWSAHKRLRTLSIYNLRYLLAYCYLMEFADKYQYVMLSDIRDVIFQKDPFDFPLGAELCCFGEKEGVTLGEDPINAQWIESAFDKSTLQKISDRQIVCSGITIGPSSLILQYLEKFIDLILQSPGKGWDFVQRGIHGSPLNGLDQGIHNYLVHNCLIPKIALYENNRGPVLTLGLEDSILVNESGTILNNHGDMPNVVHQYDRHWPIAKRHYGFRLRTNHYLDRAKAPVSKGLRTFTPTFHRALLRARAFLFRS